MALVATIAVVSLVAILGVATLSLSTRLRLGSALSLRDARLSAAAAYGLGSVFGDWRARSFGALAKGLTSHFEVTAAGSPVPATVSVTALGEGLFWLVAEAQAIDGSARRENLIVRVWLPTTESLLRDSLDLTRIGRADLDSLAAGPDTELSAGAVWSARDGLTHAFGDVVVTGGVARGVLIVEGRLFIAGPLSYSGVIIARGGIETSTHLATVTGIVRVPVDRPLPGDLTYSINADTAKVVLAKVLTPRPVAGRRSVDMY